jgi:acetate kinase
VSTVLVRNAGSSSIRNELVDPATASRPMAGTVERRPWCSHPMNAERR